MSNADIASALYRDLGGSLLVHPYQLDLLRDAIMLIRLAPRDISDASFLDQRLLSEQRQAAWFTWEQIISATSSPSSRTRAHLIFHVGHCGSTLVSRLLDDLGVLGLREPLPLRTLADIHADLDRPESRWSADTFNRRLLVLRDLFDRGQGPRSVKATSFCNDLAAPLLRTDPARRATIVYVRLRPYLANVLVGPNSRLDVLSTAPLRLKRLTARAGCVVGRLAQMSPGVISAMSWAAEMSALAAIADEFHDRVHLVDFDVLLDDVSAALTTLAEHVAPGGITADAIATAVAGPSLKRYSKAPEYAYDANLRRNVLGDGERQFGDEIRQGIQWCESAGQRVAAVARALDLFDRPH